ncbi:pyridoxal-phosphate-dependent aminotransferase family protein [Luteolibacter algae]|uniref:Pyridoxal-phosphate-dependent aminotransferase family protein n=1 Tax=Luteolibacter algae TaxID=454151 RepID=A0ABW5D551_9BACT
MSSPKLFNPGPVDVSPETFAAMSHTMIGHRGKDFEELYASLQPGLKEIFGTERPVFLSTSSAWGVMEGALRNLVKEKVLCLCCGAFSDKWLDVAKKCGYEAEAIQVEWGEAIDPEEVRKKLSEGGFDTVTLIHSETSTGVLNDLAGVAKVVKSFPDTMLIVDTVSSLSTVDVDMDANGVDVMLAGVQKALALPPGLALFAVSEAAMERSKTIPNRGYYFDFLEFAKNDAANNTPTTPCISLLFGLQFMLGQIAKEGFSARKARHARTNAMIADWAEKHGFQNFAPEGYRSLALSCFATPEDFDQATFIKELKSRYNFLINGGYGKIKGKTFRISNMGNETEDSMQELIDAMDIILEEMKG